MSTKNTTIVGRVESGDGFRAEVRVEHEYDQQVAVYIDGVKDPLALTPAEARRLSNLLNDAAMEVATPP
jgi:hypothetical protein